MSYTIPEIKVAAYNWTELPNMTQAERALWQGLGWCYECYRCGEDKTECDRMAKQYIEMYERRLKLYE